MRRSDPTPRVRNLVWERDGHACVRCGGVRHWAGFSIHHRRLRSHPFPGLHGPANLIVLCGSGAVGCHAWVHAHPAESYEAGWLVKSTLDPATIPVLTRHGMVLLNTKGGYRPWDER